MEGREVKGSRGSRERRRADGWDRVAEIKEREHEAEITIWEKERCADAPRIA